MFSFFCNCDLPLSFGQSTIVKSIFDQVIIQNVHFLTLALPIQINDFQPVH